MTYGIQVENGSSELTLSSDGITYGYIGQATWVSTTQAFGSTTLKHSGFSTYTISWAADIIVALPVKANGSTALVTATQSGSTWTITVHKGTGSTDSDGFDIEEATEVYVFGAPISVSGYGMALYGPTGTLVADLSRSPIFYKARIAIAAATLSTSMPGGITTPTVIGSLNDYRVTSVSASPFFINRIFARGWLWNTGSSLLQRVTWQQTWTKEDGAASAVDTIRAVNALMIDAADY